MYSGSDEVNIGIVAYLPVNLLHDNITEAVPWDVPREGEVNLRGTQSRVGLAAEELATKF